jgi:antitoxin component YwqK of YwqJK toxin-antitoxin module
MRTVIFILSSALFFACNSTENPPTQTPKEEYPVEVSLEERVDYEADSSIKVVYQFDTNSNTKHGNYKEYNLTTLEGQEAPTPILAVERRYDYDRITDTEKFYYPDGQVEAIMTYKDGVHHGPFKYFYPNGQLKQSGAYVDGKIEGTLRGYYMDGTQKEEVEHQGGVTQGPFKEYNENGTLKAEGKFTSKGDDENLEYGLIKLYDAEGVLDKKMVCKDGQCCTTWTAAKGAVKPSSSLCDAIIKEFGQES